MNFYQSLVAMLGPRHVHTAQHSSAQLMLMAICAKKPINRTEIILLNGCLWYARRQNATSASSSSSYGIQNIFSCKHVPNASYMSWCEARWHKNTSTNFVFNIDVLRTRDSDSTLLLSRKKKTIGFQPHFNINWLRERNICDDCVSYCSTYIYIYVVHAEGSGQHYWRTTGANWIRPLLQCQQLKSICIALLRWLESRTQIKCKIILSIGWRKGWVALRLSAACVGVVRKVDALTIVRCWCVRMADVGCGEQHCHVTRSNMQAATGNQLNSRREYPPQPAWPSNSLSNRKLCRKSVALNIITTNESSIKWTQIISQTQSETSFHQNFANERLNWIIVSHECVSDQHRHCNKKYQNIEHAETDTNGGEHSQKFNEWMKHNDYARNKNFSFA